MMQIVPVALSMIMYKDVCDTLIEIYNFFNIISWKEISLKIITRIQEEIIVILYELHIYSLRLEI
jgi:hypothetical protein